VTVQFPIPESLTITNPDSSSSWEVGTSHYINWNSTGNIYFINIELYKGSIFEMVIYSSKINNGEYRWKIPSNFNASDDYQIKISDLYNSTTFDFSDYFEIKSPSRASRIPGYNVFIIIGALSLLSIILVKKRIK